jgi:hypothetical protein
MLTAITIVINMYHNLHCYFIRSHCSIQTDTVRRIFIATLYIVSSCVYCVCVCSLLCDRVFWRSVCNESTCSPTVHEKSRVIRGKSRIVVHDNIGYVVRARTRILATCNITSFNRKFFSCSTGTHITNTLKWSKWKFWNFTSSKIILTTAGCIRNL